MKNNKEQYLVPELTVVSFHVEHGLTVSNNPQNSFQMFFMNETQPDGYNDQGQQEWADDQSNILGNSW